ncbi:MAG: helix-turn-helix domain-containing protein [Firmicutes bacterium]|nr:helix-turn-helix domain-containing protein [Bacillota bacterium]
MLKENLIMLRNMRGFSQEEIAGKIHISRQAYAKWESGATVPDIEKCALLAKVYGVTVDSLIKDETVDGVGVIPPAPAGKSIWGTVTVNDRGQIVIPKDARDKFGIRGGTRLIVAADEIGIALIPVETFEAGMKRIMEYAYIDANTSEKNDAGQDGTG